MNISRISSFATLLILCLSTISCGYHLGGLKSDKLEHVDTFSLRMFENNSLEPLAAILMNNAIGEILQRDGSYKLASSASADCYITGEIKSIDYTSLRPDPDDTYISEEIGIVLTVTYQITETKTGKLLMSNQIDEETSYFNNVGNVQTSRENALSYAARKIAYRIAVDISI